MRRPGRLERPAQQGLDLDARLLARLVLGELNADPLLPARRFRLTGMAVHSVDEGDRDFQILVLMQADEGTDATPPANVDQQVEPLPLVPSPSC